MSNDPTQNQPGDTGPQFEQNPYDFTTGPSNTPVSGGYPAPGRESGPLSDTTPYPPPPPELPMEQPSENLYGSPPPIMPTPVYVQPLAGPLPLGQAIQQLPNQYIKVTTKPGAQSFFEEMGKAEWGIVWLQLVILAAISVVLSLLGQAINPAAATSTTNSSSLDPQTVALIREVATSATGFGGFFLTIGGFFLTQGITFGVARLFKGQGTFLAQCYTALLFQVPLGIASSLLALIPILGIIASLAVTIYSVVLQVYSIMAVHRLSGGKATGVVLIPFGVLFLLICCTLFAVVALAVNAVGGQTQP